MVRSSNPVVRNAMNATISAARNAVNPSQKIGDWAKSNAGEYDREQIQQYGLAGVTWKQAVDRNMGEYPSPVWKLDTALRDAIIDNIEELAIKSGAVIKPETVVEDPFWKGKRSIELSWKYSRGLANEATSAVNKVNGMRKRMQNALVVIDKLMGMKIDGKVEDMLVDMQDSAQRALAILGR